MSDSFERTTKYEQATNFSSCEEESYSVGEKQGSVNGEHPVPHTVATTTSSLALVYLTVAFLHTRMLCCIHKTVWFPRILSVFLLLTRPHLVLSDGGLKNSSASEEEFNRRDLDASALDNEYTAFPPYYGFLTLLVVSVVFVTCVCAARACFQDRDRLQGGANRELTETGQRPRASSSGQAAVPCDSQAASAHPALPIAPGPQHRPPRRVVRVNDSAAAVLPPAVECVNTGGIACSHEEVLLKKSTNKTRKATSEAASFLVIKEGVLNTINVASLEKSRHPRRLCADGGTSARDKDPLDARREDRDRTEEDEHSSSSETEPSGSDEIRQPSSDESEFSDEDLGMRLLHSQELDHTRVHAKVTVKGHNTTSAFVVSCPRCGYASRPPDATVSPNPRYATRLTVPPSCDDNIVVAHQQHDGLGAFNCLVDHGSPLCEIELAPPNADAHVAGPAPQTFEAPCLSEMGYVRPFAYNQEADPLDEELEFE